MSSSSESCGLLDRLGSLGTWLRTRKAKRGQGSKAELEDRVEVGQESAGREGANVQTQEENQVDIRRRDLPPVPEQDPREDEDDGHDVNVRLEEEEGFLVDGEEVDGNTAYMIDDDEDEDEQGFGRLRSGTDQDCSAIDMSKSIEAVKNCGWYWGPISGEVAERMLANEANGSFLVRDSSDDHYIFSLTFKLNSKVRHVRIEHDQGKFSFGSYTKFKSRTIVEFIENAVEHSRSGRYLFFLHRQPVLGPLRVQLLNPVSRFKSTVHSLQHQCRFVILQHVPRDLLHKLELPQKLKEYLNTQHYYSEKTEQCIEDTG